MLSTLETHWVGCHGSPTFASGPTGHSQAPPLSPQPDLLLQHGHDDRGKHQDGHRQDHTCQCCLQQGLRTGTGWGERGAWGWDRHQGSKSHPDSEVCTPLFSTSGSPGLLTAVHTELDPRHQTILPPLTHMCLRRADSLHGGRAAEDSLPSLGCAGIRGWENSTQGT